MLLSGDVKPSLYIYLIVLLRLPGRWRCLSFGFCTSLFSFLPGCWLLWGLWKELIAGVVVFRVDVDGTGVDAATVDPQFYI